MLAIFHVISQMLHGTGREDIEGIFIRAARYISEGSELCCPKIYLIDLSLTRVSFPRVFLKAPRMTK